MDNTRRVVYIEDNEGQRKINGDAFVKGLADESVRVEVRENFLELEQELIGDAGKELADVYIMDNEILAQRGGGLGTEMAEKILLEAEKREKDVLVITLLCSNPKEAKRCLTKKTLPDGTNLSDVVPCLDKQTEAAFCGFYVATILRDGKLLLDGNLCTFDAWLREKGLTHVIDQELSVRDGINIELSRGIAGKAVPEGGFYREPKEIAAERVEIVKEKIRAFTLTGNQWLVEENQKLLEGMTSVFGLSHDEVEGGKSHGIENR